MCFLVREVRKQETYTTSLSVLVCRSLYDVPRRKEDGECGLLYHIYIRLPLRPCVIFWPRSDAEDIGLFAVLSFLIDFRATLVFRYVRAGREALVMENIHAFFVCLGCQEAERGGH